MKLTDFFARNPVFTGEELAAFLAANGSTNASTRKSLLAHHKAAGHVIAARRDLFILMRVVFPVWRGTKRKKDLDLWVVSSRWIILQNCNVFLGTGQ